jgi:hypothetical protein
MPHSHLKFLVAEQFGDRMQVHVAHNQAACECKPQITRAEVMYFGVCNGIFEPVPSFETRGPRFGDRSHRCVEMASDATMDNQLSWCAHEVLSTSL